MSRRWVSLVATVFGLAAVASCSLDIGAVKKPGQDAGGGGNSSDGSPTDVAPDVPFDFPPGCVNLAVVTVQCEPRTNEGCPTGLGCDLVVYPNPPLNILQCVPNDGIKLGGACNGYSGPFCEPKLACTGSPGICAKYCCTAADCPGGGYCVNFRPDFGTIGTCSNVDAGTAADGG